MLPSAIDAVENLLRMFGSWWDFTLFMHFKRAHPTFISISSSSSK